MSNAANGGAAARMQRLLAMVPWIVAQDGPLTSEVCARFEVTPEQLMAFVAEQVAPYKKIRCLEVVDQIPKSPSGKILRRVLVERDKAHHTL